MLGHGVHQPCGQSGAVGPFPRIAGTASALNGFVMMLAAFAMGGWLGWRMDGTVFPLTNGIWFWSVRDRGHRLDPGAETRRSRSRTRIVRD